MYNISRAEVKSTVLASEIDRIAGEPTHDALTTARRQLTEILAAIPSDLGGGKHGLVGILYDDREYNAIARTTFVRPDQPKSKPPYKTTMSSAEVAIAKAGWMSEWDNYNSVMGADDGAKDLLLKCVDEEWVEALCDDQLGYSRLTAHDVYLHLKTKCGVVSNLDANELINERDTPIDFDSPLILYFNRYNRCIKQLRECKVTQDESERLVKALLHFQQNDDYEEAVEEWEAKADADQTWSTFQKHFCDAEAEINHKAKLKRTTKAAGYHSHQANQAKQVTTDIKDAYTMDEIDTLLQEFANVTEERIQQATGVKDSGASTDLMKVMEQQTKLLATLADEVKEMKVRARVVAGGGGGGERKPACKHCNRYHPRVPVEKCFLHPDNKDKPASEGGPPEGFKAKEKKA